MASGVVIENQGEDDNKAYTVALYVGNTKVAEYRCESMDEEFLPVSIMGVGNVSAGTHQIRLVLENVEYRNNPSGLSVERITVAGFQAQLVEGSG